MNIIQALIDVLGTYNPQQYNISATSFVVIDVPWVCGFVLICICLCALIKGLFSVIRLFSHV